MKLYFILNLIAVGFASLASALTLEEYAALPPAGKIEVLKGNPDPLLSNQTELLRLFTISLRDSSPALQRIAAQTSVYLMLGLQEAKPLGKMPAFTEEDSTGLQHALVALLDHQDRETRAAAAMALVYSAPPHEAIEKLLLARLEKEAKQELAAGILEAMGNAGYTSEVFLSATMAHMQPDVDIRAIYYAGKVLAHLRPESALDTLIALAAKASPAQQHALRTLAAYGPAGERAKPMLEKLSQDESMNADIRLLARQALEAITAGKTPEVRRKDVKLVTLWPLALPEAGPAPPKENGATPGGTQPSVQPNSPNGTVDDPKAAIQSDHTVWLLTGAGVAGLLLVTWVLLKRRT